MNQITTARTKLRRFQIVDLENMILLESNPAIMKFTPMRIPQTPEQSLQRLQNTIAREQSFGDLGIWAAELKNTNEFFGWFMLMKDEIAYPELGFMLVQSFWGQGLATEVSQALINHAFVLGHAGIASVTDADNPASMQVLQKLGFQLIKEYSKFDQVLQRDVKANYFERAAVGRRQ